MSGNARGSVGDREGGERMKTRRVYKDEDGISINLFVG